MKYLNKGLYPGVLFLFAVIGHAGDIAPLSLEVWGKLPYIKSPSVSPDGKHIAALISVDGEYQIGVASFEERRLHLIHKIAENERARLNWVEWVNDSRLVASYSWLRGTSGLKTASSNDLLYTRLLAMDLDGGDIKYLEYDISRAVKGSKVGKKTRIFNAVDQDDVIDFMPYDDKHIMIQMDGGVDLNMQHVYKLNVYTGRYDEVQRNFQNIHSWYTDQEGHLRLGIAFDENVSSRKEYHYRSIDSDKWEKVLEYKVFKDSDMSFVGFNSTADKLYFISYQDYDNGALYLFDPKTKQMSSPMYRHEHLQIGGASTNSRGDVTGVYYVDDLPTYYDVDEKVATLRKALHKMLSSESSQIISQDLKSNRKIILSEGRKHPPIYFLHDAEANSLKTWYPLYPQINSEAVAAPQSITFKARDGMQLYGYLTLPLKTNGKLPPAIVLVHGGPWARDTAQFDPQVQALTSLGYAVLQVNFRGSSGYGVNYETAGYQQWGLKMQEDIADGLQWVRAQEYVDAKRACIMGSSYGGYAALMGVIKDPDLYRCAISFAGVTDLVSLTREHSYRGSFYYELVGGKSMDEIRTTSPLHMAEKIKVPLLLAHGERDTVVSSVDSKDMANKLKHLEKEHELLLFENGDHHFSIEQDRIDYLKAVERFLQKYMPI